MNLDYYLEENEEVFERYQLSMERILEMKQEETVRTELLPYIRSVVSFLTLMDEVVMEVRTGSLRKKSLHELQEQNTKLYADVLPENYATSYANPAYAVGQLGDKYGKLLSFLYIEIRSVLPKAFEYHLYPVTILLELFIEIYNYLEEETEYTAKDIKRTLYYYAHDYCEELLEFRVRETSDPAFTFAKDIIAQEDLNDLRYLYFFGEYIGDNERKVAEYLAKQTKEDIQAMADTYTEGYVRGFHVTGADLSKKTIVSIRYILGFERMVKAAIENFEAMGKKVILPRMAHDVVNRVPGRRSGFHGTSVNEQYEYDHRYDRALFTDKVVTERMFTAAKKAYEKYRTELTLFAGPAVMEAFGTPDFKPVNKPETYRLDDKQQKLMTEYMRDMNLMAMEYIKSEEISFTIIAYPLPSIGKDFEAIFAETIHLNTLDNAVYQKIQQSMIDVLDEGAYVRILGSAENHTDLTVQLYDHLDGSKETIFENCTADVNIPVGEVFTSPKLTGTNGVLHVSKVFLSGLEYQNLALTFVDGMISDYHCTNFANEEENRQLLRETVLMNHETLPMGEFAIGTNTTAYAMAQKYDIQRKLPILIAEKTGPHFAVGDTCYHMSEDHKVYNPDGKEIIARDNEVSILRKTDIEKAYYNCHTDITIPYNEIGEISVYKRDGSKTDIIRDGRFVLKGTELLNQALDLK